LKIIDNLQHGTSLVAVVGVGSNLLTTLIAISNKMQTVNVDKT
jgi:hypothetical protein